MITASAIIVGITLLGAGGQMSFLLKCVTEGSYVFGAVFIFAVKAVIYGAPLLFVCGLDYRLRHIGMGTFLSAG